MAAGLAVVTIRERPDLVPIVAGWLWEAFWRRRGTPLAEVRALVASGDARAGSPQCFVLLDGPRAIGTASLVAHDLDARPDLTPWLAGVYVVPEARGRGNAGRLIAAVEAACRSARLPGLWLYTVTAERVYSRAGWQVAERFAHAGDLAALMHRDLR